MFDTVNAANDKAARLEYRLGHPQRRNVVFRHESSTVRTDYLTDPPPCVSTVSPRLVDVSVGQDNRGEMVYIAANDLTAMVSRSVPYSRFVRSDGLRVRAWVYERGVDVGTVVLDGNGKPQGAVEYRVIHVADGNCCDWRLVLRKIAD